MTEFFYNLMHPLPNGVMTVIMGVLTLYWFFVFLSGIGLEDVDLGFDFDVPDVDVDAGVEVEGDVDTSGVDDIQGKEGPGFFMKFLQFLNVGRVPFMLIFTTFKFFLWIGSLITTSFINVGAWGATSLLILLPLGVVAIFFTRFATNPMARFFEKIGYKGEEQIDFLGRSGKMLSNIRDEKIGYAEVVVDKNPFKLYVKSIDGKELKYGDDILIADETEDKKIFLVTQLLTLDKLTIDS